MSLAWSHRQRSLHFHVASLFRFGNHDMTLAPWNIGQLNPNPNINPNPNPNPNPNQVWRMWRCAWDIGR